jgi:hypothetical protein
MALEKSMTVLDYLLIAKIWFSHISTTELEEKLAKELNLGSFEERPF